MSNHPNRGWRYRWTVDAAHHEVRHGPTGLVVRFERATDLVAWDGHATNGEDVASALRALHGDSSAARMLARLMREAGDAFKAGAPE